MPTSELLRNLQNFPQRRKVLSGGLRCICLQGRDKWAHTYLIYGVTSVETEHNIYTEWELDNVRDTEAGQWSLNDLLEINQENWRWSLWSGALQCLVWIFFLNILQSGGSKAWIRALVLVQSDCWAFCKVGSQARENRIISRVSLKLEVNSNVGQPFLVALAHIPSSSEHRYLFFIIYD